MNDIEISPRKAGLAIVLTFLVLGIVGASYNSVARPREQGISIGSLAHLSVPGGPDQLIPLAVREDGLSELVKAEVIHDSLGLVGMMRAGRAFAVTNGTRVMLIDTGFDKRQVRVLEGPHIGAAGWTTPSFVAR